MDGRRQVLMERQPQSTGDRRGCHSYLILDLPGQLNFLQVGTSVGFLILYSAKSRLKNTCARELTSVISDSLENSVGWVMLASYHKREN